MEEFKLKIANEKSILSLGAESAGNFSVYKDGVLYFSHNFGDLLEEENFYKFRTEVFKFLKDNKIKPEIIISDLHPNFHTTLLAQDLTRKYKATYVPIQHHIAHIFSAIGDKIIVSETHNLKSILGIACDGTGFGLNGKIWGGEVFSFQLSTSSFQAKRVAHLENQVLIGGEKAIQEPARILISILSKIYPSSHVVPGLTRNPDLHLNLDSRFHGNDKAKKDFVFSFVKKYYPENEFEVLWNQLEQNFNCLETSSTARILDAVSVLLGFSKNERLSKHGSIALLEKNSTNPYTLKPKLVISNSQFPISKQIPNQKIQISNKMLILNTTYLFKYLIKNLHKDKSRLAATAQKYIADGLVEIVKLKTKSLKLEAVYFSGGMANNKIMSEILESHGIYTSKKIPHGDAGISFGQLFFYLLTNPRD
ncbi:MAG: hypothetical protein ACD_8C00146G0012 [uncultured bacterium]|nr:MAG: hypothetical protein ACD_8C00146G0012 [uncultured bacterium]